MTDFAVKTYRYLRIALVVMIFALGASVILERFHATRFQESISAYYYTPAHSVFVAALVAIGACLVALKGCCDTEDVLLNVAGMLAPIVAFVPTSEPSIIYGSTALTIKEPRTLVGNNVVALLIAGAGALIVAYLVDRNRTSSAVPRVRTVDKIGLGVATGLIVIGGGLYWQQRTWFLAHAHTVSAIAMFVVLGAVVLFNARRAGVRGKKAYQRRYYAAAGIMASGVLVFLAHLALDDWKPWNFTLESVEMVGFATFWIVQTFELWEFGVDPVPETALMPKVAERLSKTAPATA